MPQSKDIQGQVATLNYPNFNRITPWIDANKPLSPIREWTVMEWMNEWIRHHQHHWWFSLDWKLTHLTGSRRWNMETARVYQLISRPKIIRLVNLSVIPLSNRSVFSILSNQAQNNPTLKLKSSFITTRRVKKKNVPRVNILPSADVFILLEEKLSVLLAGLSHSPRETATKKTFPLSKSYN